MNRLISMLFLMMLPWTAGRAADFRGADAITIYEGDTLHQDLYAGCRYLTINGPVLGDIYAGCERISIEAPVSDDVFAGCQDLIIKGPVGDGVMGFARTILIDAEIMGDLVAFGAELRLTEKAHIHGDIFLGTGEFFLDGGMVDGKIRGGTGDAYLNGKVGKSVELEADWVYFDSLYTAGAGTKLTLSRELDEKKNGFIPDGVEVIIKTPAAFYESIFFYWGLLSFIVVGILLISFCRNFSRDYVVYSRTAVWKKMGLGFLALVMTPVVAVILIILLITLPVGLIISAVYLILLYLAYVFAALIIGDRLIRFVSKNEKYPLIWPLLLGLLCVVLVDKIPFVGWLCDLVILCFGLGSLIGYIWREIKPAVQTA
jgi:hypothetical protein